MKTLLLLLWANLHYTIKLIFIAMQFIAENANVYWVSNWSSISFCNYIENRIWYSAHMISFLMYLFFFSSIARRAITENYSHLLSDVSISSGMRIEQNRRTWVQLFSQHFIHGTGEKLFFLRGMICNKRNWPCTRG